ncbi:SPOR domain-containing protein [Azospirillum sp.]|uniref:SPOR domain-containing protein n=1 Tax=Azospirillum sp. TaxID=34012 RepID=UPI002D3E5CFF|nr:SPOR domain-containing protein [Azospirillum sp.]HYF86986.1 SPOR domain-containing protein [Azospirillum sp.]
MTLKPPPRQAPTLSTPTFKDEMKANGKPSETPPPENEDIAKLLRALNEDLHADQQDEVDDDEEEPASRSLPLGKIALALLAAGGIAVGIVYLGSGDPEPVTTAANTSSPMVPAPAITRAPQNATPSGAAPSTNGTPAAAVTPPAQTPPNQTAPATPPAASSAPPPPVAALPASPPPVLKVPEPPPVPATAPAAAPKPRATAPAESAPPPAAQKPEASKPDTAKPDAAKPEHPAAGEPADTGSLQAMLAPPKEAAKRPPASAAPAATPAAPPAPPVASSANGEAKLPAKAATPPSSMPAGRYTVQVGTFSVTANADSLAQRLQGGGFQAYTVDWTDNSNRSWRAVRVGGFADQTAARREAEQLKTKMGLNPVVITAR